MVDRITQSPEDANNINGYTVWRVHKFSMGGEKIERWLRIGESFNNEIDAISFAMNEEDRMLPGEKIGKEIVVGPIVDNLNEGFKS